MQPWMNLSLPPLTHQASVSTFLTKYTENVSDKPLKYSLLQTTDRYTELSVMLLPPVIFVGLSVWLSSCVAFVCNILFCGFWLFSDIETHFVV